MAQYDEIDCAIMELLQRQGDLPNVELAHRVKLSPAACSRRVQRLRQDGVITGVHAAVDPGKVGIRVEAFVLVTLAEHTNDSDKRFRDALAEMPTVIRADTVTGPDDVLLHIVAADTRELQDVLRQLPRFGASRINTLLRLDEVKSPSPYPVRRRPT